MIVGNMLLKYGFVVMQDLAILLPSAQGGVYNMTVASFSLVAVSQSLRKRLGS